MFFCHEDRAGKESCLRLQAADAASHTVMARLLVLITKKKQVAFDGMLVVSIMLLLLL